MASAAATASAAAANARTPHLERLHVIGRNARNRAATVGSPRFRNRVNRIGLHGLHVDLDDQMAAIRMRGVGKSFALGDQIRRSLRSNPSGSIAFGSKGLRPVVQAVCPLNPGIRRLSGCIRRSDGAPLHRVVLTKLRNVAQHDGGTASLAPGLPANRHRGSQVRLHVPLVGRVHVLLHRVRRVERFVHARRDIRRLEHVEKARLRMEPRQRAPAAQHGRKARGNHRRALASRALVRQIERRSPTISRLRMHSPAHYKIAPCPNSLIARAESSSHASFSSLFSHTTVEPS